MPPLSPIVMAYVSRILIKCFFEAFSNRIVNLQNNGKFEFEVYVLAL